MTDQRTTARRRNRPRLEALEDRALPSVSVIENFEGSSLAAYQTALRATPSDVLLPIAAHDGLVGLVKQDGYEWLIRNDAGTQMHQGDTVSVWTQLAGAADGRAYLGFDSQNSGAVHSPISAGGTLAVVLAPNTNQLIIQKDSGGNGVASFTNVATVAQTYQADHWYRLEASWGAGGLITARLYDSDGITLLNTASGTTTAPFPAGGGIALRAFGHDKYFDSVVVDSGSTGTADERANAGGGLDPSWVPGDPPAPVGNGPAGDPAPVPWQYTGTPGTGIEVQLAQFNGLQQVAIVGGTVGLAAGNNSLITGTVQVGWGEPLETPLLAQYIFRELPGDQTRLVGASSVKHFFSSAHADSQHLNPGENDTYGAGLNASQSLYTYGSEIDPVTGTLHSPIDRIGTTGRLSDDGIVVQGNRTFSSPIDMLLQVNVSDLDPAQNPAGTRWFLMGNEFVGGEQDVAQASRWVEITPAFNGTTFTFTYPSGAGGQLDFHTIPNLATPAPGPVVTSSTPSGTNNVAPITTATVNFDRPIDASTFTPDKVTSFTGPDGPHAVNSVAPVTGSNSSFVVRFDPLTAPGSYTLLVGPDIRDTDGHQMAQFGVEGQDPYTLTFGIQNLQVVSAVPNSILVGQATSLRFTFNEPVNPDTFTTDVFLGFDGPDGGHAFTAVAAVAGSNNTQFDAQFDALTLGGGYTVVLGPYVADQFNNYLGDSYTTQFTLTGGPSVVSFSPAGDVSGPVDHVRVTFDRAIDGSTFTPAQVTFLDSGGNPIPVGGVAEVDGTGQTQYDVSFDPQSALGSYALTLSTDIADPFGNHLVGGVAGQLVTNGDFETGTFSGWTQSGNTGSTSVGGTAHNGRFAANLGPVGSEGFLAQGLATSPGSTYTLDYWLSNGGGTPNRFEAYVNGAVVAGSALSDAGAFGYREYTFTFVATGATTELKFGFQQDPSYYYLDDVSVTQVGGGLTDQFRIV